MPAQMKVPHRAPIASSPRAGKGMAQQPDGSQMLEKGGGKTSVTGRKITCVENPMAKKTDCSEDDQSEAIHHQETERTIMELAHEY